MERSATAIWRGGPGAGEGQVTTSSGVVQNALFAFGSSFGNEPCTSPTEMLAAALASCTSMMVAQELSRIGIRSESINTSATLKLEQQEDGWRVVKANVKIGVKVGEIDPSEFHKAIQVAAGKCPIARALNVKVTLESKLEPVAMHANA
jgi:lipoyl-dependent peroxiredoxin